MEEPSWSHLGRHRREHRLQLLLRLLQIAKGRLALDRVHAAAEVRVLPDGRHVRAVEVVLHEHLLEHVARLDVVDDVLGHLELRVARELLHRVRLVREDRLAREELEEHEAVRPHVQGARRAHPVAIGTLETARVLTNCVERRVQTSCVIFNNIIVLIIDFNHNQFYKILT